MAEAQLITPEEPFDFTGYVLFDEMDRLLRPKDVWNVLAFDPHTVEEKRCFPYKNLILSKLCAIVKFRSEEDAQTVIKRCRENVPPLKGIHGLHVPSALRAISDLETALTGRVNNYVLQSDIIVRNFDNTNGRAKELVTSTLRQFGEICSVRIHGNTNDPRVTAGVSFKYYSNAVAAHVACHGTLIRGGLVSVVPIATRETVFKFLLDRAADRLQPDHKNKLKVALFNACF